VRAGVFMDVVVINLSVALQVINRVIHSSTLMAPSLGGILILGETTYFDYS
jgi:hypothetical protein